MGLPLPKVVADVGPGGGIVTARQGINALRQSAFENDIAKSNAQYAPYTNYANALSKIAYAQYSPLDIQSKLLSNPALLMAIKDDPQALAALTSNTNNLMKGIQSNGTPGSIGGMSLPTPQQIQGSNNSLGSGLLNWLSNSVMGNKQNAMNPQQQPNAGIDGWPETPYDKNGIPNAVPLKMEGQENTGMYPSKGLQGYVDIKTAPMSEQLHKPGTSYIGPDGKIHSVASPSTVSANQNAIIAINRVTPQLQRLSKAAAPFMTASGQFDVWKARGKNFLLGDSNKLPSDYAKFQAELKAAPESLLKGFGLRATNETIDQMKGVIEPITGESAKGYESRILQTLMELQTEQQGAAKEALSGGIDVSDTRNQAMLDTEKPTKLEKNDNSITLSGGLIVPKSWPSEDAFKKWYRSQPKTTKLAYQEHLKGNQ